jgi:hypothetical protein
VLRTARHQTCRPSIPEPRQLLHFLTVKQWCRIPLYPLPEGLLNSSLVPRRLFSSSHFARSDSAPLHATCTSNGRYSFRSAFCPAELSDTSLDCFFLAGTAERMQELLCSRPAVDLSRCIAVPLFSYSSYEQSSPGLFPAPLHGH